MKIPLLLAALCSAAPAYADDAPRDWSQSMSYRTSSEQAVNFNKAQAEYLHRHGIVPGSSTVTVNHNCTVAGACQQGGTATNVNGYSSNTITGDGNTVGVGIEADAEQDATSSTIVVEEIDDIDFH